MSKQEKTVEAEFTEVNEEVEAVEENVKPEDNILDRGIIVFHDDQNKLCFKILGTVDLQDMTYYRRYLDKLEEEHWDTHMYGSEEDSDAGVQE